MALDMFVLLLSLLLLLFVFPDDELSKYHFGSPLCESALPYFRLIADKDEDFDFRPVGLV